MTARRRRGQPPSLVRRQSIRVALAAAAIVAVAYLAIAGGVYALTSANLVGQMDERIDHGVGSIRHDPRPAPPGGYDPEKETAFGPILYVWTIHPDGATFSNYADSPRLPVDPRSITSPQTAQRRRHEPARRRASRSGRATWSPASPWRRSRRPNRP